MTIRQRLFVIGFLFLVAPISAEFSSGYLQSTGDPAGLLMQFVIFAPFYGGAAVLIREAAVRARLSRSGLLVLATAVGLAHASLIDRSIFTLTGTEVAFWPEIMAPTWLAGPGFAAGPAVGGAWVTRSLASAHQRSCWTDSRRRRGTARRWVFPAW